MAAAAKSALSKRIIGLGAKQTPMASVIQSASSYLGQSTYKQLNAFERYPHPEIPDFKYDPIETKSSRLSNGIRVVSRNSPDPICNIGVYIQAGSRYCTPETSGIGHFLESLAVEGTNNILPDRFHENLARTGSGLMVQAYRDAMIYQIETFNKHADFALESIAELLYNAPIKPYIISKLQKQYLWKRGDVMKESDHEIPEYIHQASYQGNTLGLPLYCDENSIKNINVSTLEEYIKIFYQPNRMTITGIGIEHEQLLEISNKIYGNLENDSKEYKDIKFATAHYTGGQLTLKYDFNDLEPNLIHIALIFETETWKSKDLIPLCVLNMMMGGGGTFSAGGPGKGMYTRLYRNVLGKYKFINHISSSHSLYDDSGIFCFYVNGPSDHAGDIIGVTVLEAINLLNQPFSNDELQRAKYAFSSNICYEFENRQVVFEDISRQFNTFEQFKSPDMWQNEIMNVQHEDIIRVVKKILSSKPTLLAIGNDVSKIPSVSDVEHAIRNNVSL